MIELQDKRGHGNIPEERDRSSKTNMPVKVASNNARKKLERGCHFLAERSSVRARQTPRLARNHSREQNEETQQCFYLAWPRGNQIM